MNLGERIKNAKSANTRSSAGEVSASQHELIQLCQGLVRSIAWKIHQKLPRSFELNDVIAYGQLGLTQAAKEYNPGKGNKFATYAYYRIRGSILDGLQQMSWFRLSDFYASNYEHAAWYLMEAEAGETTNDVNQEMGWLSDVTAKLSSAALAGELAAVRAAAPHELDPPIAADRREMIEKLGLLIEQLPDDARKLVRGIYFEGLTLQQVSLQLGISKAWGSRLHAKTLGRLGRALRLMGVAAAT